MNIESVSALEDGEIIANLAKLVVQNNALTADIVAHLAEMDRRRLYLRAACSSLHTYCTKRLGLSDAAAYKRIAAARAVRRFPVVLDRLRSGALHLSAVVTLDPHLTTDNHVELLAMAAGKRQREIEQMVAAYSPRPDVADSIRKLPELPARRPAVMQPEEAAGGPAALTSASSSSTVEPVLALDVSALTAPSRPVDRGRSEPLSADRYRVQFTAGQPLMDKIEQARALLGHQVPGGELAAIFERALDALIADRNKKKFGATDKARTPAPRDSASSKTSKARRHIPSAVRRVVAARDGLRCTYVDEDGNRCEETRRLEFDHELSKARGGGETAENLRLRCRAHNQHRAVVELGRDHVERCIATRRAASRQRAAGRNCEPSWAPGLPNPSEPQLRAPEAGAAHR